MTHQFYLKPMFILHQLKSTLKTASCIFLLGFFPNLYAQATYEVVYNVEPVLQGSVENTSQNTKDMVKKIVDYAEGIDYILLADQNESFFEEEAFLVKGDRSPLEDIYIKGARTLTPFNKETYKNYRTDSIVFIKNLLNKDFVVKREDYDFHWEIKDAAKIILGFEAKKAEGIFYSPVKEEEFIIEAWFLPAIPLQAGPDIYTGLPGLIVEVHLSKAVIRAKTIEQKQDLSIEKPTDEAMTQKDYEDLLLRLKGKFIE